MIFFSNIGEKLSANMDLNTPENPNRETIRPPVFYLKPTTYSQVETAIQGLIVPRKLVGLMGSLVG